MHKRARAGTGTHFPEASTQCTLHTPLEMENYQHVLFVTYRNAARQLETSKQSFDQTMAGSSRANERRKFWHNIDPFLYPPSEQTVSQLLFLFMAPGSPKARSPYGPHILDGVHIQWMGRPI